MFTGLPVSGRMVLAFLFMTGWLAILHTQLQSEQVSSMTPECVPRESRMASAPLAATQWCGKPSRTRADEASSVLPRLSSSAYQEKAGAVWGGDDVEQKLQQ